MHIHLHKNISQKKHEMYKKILEQLTSKIKAETISEEQFEKKCKAVLKLRLCETDEKLRKLLNEDKEVDIDKFNRNRKFWIILFQLFKIQSFVNANWGGRKLQAQEMYMLLKHNLTSSKGWNTKTKKRCRKLNINDCAVICNCSSATPIKINALLKTSGAVASNYQDINALYWKFEQAKIKSTMFAWLLEAARKDNDVEEDSKTNDEFKLQDIGWSNDPNKHKDGFGSPIINVKTGRPY